MANMKERLKTLGARSQKELPYQSFLLLALENALGFRLDSASRCRLAEQTLEASGFRVSYSTLYRFSQNTPDGHSFYRATLDLLSQFVGKSDWDEFREHCDRDQRFMELAGVVGDFKVHSLIRRCIEHKELRGLYAFCESLPSDLNNDLTVRLGYELFRSLQVHSASTVRFYRNFSCLPFIRKAFFEYLADPEFRLANYDQGLKAYLNQVDCRDGGSSLQAFVFANCLLLRQAYFIGRLREVRRIANLLYADGSIARAVENMDGLPKFRFLCYRVLWFHAQGQYHLAEATHLGLTEQFVEQVDQARPFEQEMMLNTLLDVLMLIGASEEDKRSLVEGMARASSYLDFKSPSQFNAVLAATDHTRANWFTRGVYR
jgi:hypothetical protein